MFSNNSISKKLIFSVFLGCLIPFLIGGFYLIIILRQNLITTTTNNSQQFLEQMGSYIDTTLIQKSKEVVTLLSRDERVINVDQSIATYKDYSVDQPLPQFSYREKIISNFFKAVKDSQPEINFVFLGLANGGYIEYPTFKPTNPYDPTQRPWYTTTLTMNEVLLSEPYLSKVTNELIVSFTKTIIRKNEKLGVVGISIRLDTLAQKLNAIQLNNNGSLFVLSSQNRFIVCPSHPEWLLKTPEEVGFLALQSLPTDVTHFETQLDGSTKIFNQYLSPKSGWRIISFVNKKDIIAQTTNITHILLSIYIVTLLITYLVIRHISHRITRPILSISEIIKAMAVNQYDYSQAKPFEKYLKKKDEIGRMAQAINEMHDNFAELNQHMTEMNLQIQQTDLEKNIRFHLNLSDNNPFSTVADSINILLDRIAQTILKLQKSNRDLATSNLQLIESEVTLHEQLHEIESQRDMIHFLAYHDALTALPNRRQFVDALQEALFENESGAVILLDLDNFKSINDTLGHAFGDKVLKAVAERLNEHQSDRIFVSRFGGDEFLILYKGTVTKEILIDFLNELKTKFEQSFNIDYTQIDIAFSIGVSQFPEDSNDVDQLIMNSDVALYSVKNKGKNHYSFFDNSMSEDLLLRSQVELSLKDALDNNGFKMVYQPQVDLTTGDTLAYEALIRMRHAPIPPNVFIPIAEETGLIIGIGRFVTREVIRQIAVWQEAGHPVKPVSINFSAHQLRDTYFLTLLQDALTYYQVSPALIEIEITESIFLENKEGTLRFLEHLQQMGIKISIDDFGTGYSSLSYLTFLPVDKIKLDRSLSDKFLELSNIKVMDSLISLAHSLDLEVVAEGIESYEQVRRLRVGNCDSIQGYYFSRPMEADQVYEHFGVNYITML